MLIPFKQRVNASTARPLAAAVLLLAGLAGMTQVHAQALKYTATNPHFGGSPFNGAELLSSAAAQKDEFKPIQLPAGKSALSNFANNLDARISAGLAQYISNQLFSATGTGDKEGTVTLGDLRITYLREGTTVKVDMQDTKTGDTQSAVYPLNIFVP